MKNYNFNNNVSTKNLLKTINGRNDNSKIEVFEEFRRFYQSNTTFREGLYKYNLLNTILYLEDLFGDKEKAEKLLFLLIKIDGQKKNIQTNFLLIMDEFEVSLGIKNNGSKNKSACQLRNLIELLGYEKSMKVLSNIYNRNKNRMKFIEENNKDKDIFDFDYISPSNYNIIGLHDLSLNLPNKWTDKNVTRNYINTFREECFNFINKIINNYSDLSLIFLFLNFINYEKVRVGKNKNDIVNYINVVREARSRKTSDFKTGGLQEFDLINNYKLLIDNNFNDYFIEFSKKPCHVNSIGEKTLCCFKPGGLAKMLLPPAIYSPISGIIFGYFNKKCWFSFVWEIVEWNNSRKTFDINLILDNIEANSSLNCNEFCQIYNKLKNNSNYNTVYLGDMRNDISDDSYFLMESINDENSNRVKKRPYTLVDYEKNFRSYSYDDSKNLLTLFSNNKVDTKNIIVERMNKSWLHRCKYIERMIYKEKSDDEFLNIDVEKSPSYVIHSNNNIFGYLCTRLLKMRKSDNYIFFNKSEFNKLKKEENFKEEDFTDIIYFEDIFIQNNRKIISSLKFIIEDIKKFIEENKINYYSASFNKYSKSFKKRLDSLEFIEDNRFTEENAIISEEDILKKYRNNLLDNNIKIINNL